MKRFFGRISKRAWIITAIVVGALALGGGGVYAYTQIVAPRLAQGGYGPAAAAASRQGQQAARKKKRAANGGATGAGGGGTAAQLQRLIASGIRGQATVADASAPGGYVVIAWARGSLTSVDATTGQVSIQEADGTSASYSVPAGARVMVNGAQGTLGALQQGTNVIVVTKQTQGGTATVMAVVSQAATAAGATGNGTSTPTPAGG